MSIVTAGCDVAVRTECMRDLANDGGATEVVSMAITKNQREYEWLGVQAASHLICDFDFVTYNPTPTVYRFPNLRLSPCGEDSVFVAERLQCGNNALVDVSYCRMQTADYGLLSVAVRETHLQWKHDIMHLHVILNTTVAKEKFSALQQYQQHGEAMVALDATSTAHKMDVQGYVMGSPESGFSVTNPGRFKAGGTEASVAPHAPATLPADAAAMLQLRLQSMDDLLFTIKAAAAVLISAFLWALWQIQKPRPKSSGHQRSSPQGSPRQMMPSAPCSSCHHVHTLRNSTRAPKSVVSGPVPDETKARDFLAKDETAPASICDRLEQDWTQSRQPRIDTEPRRIMKPLTSKRNPFAVTWIRAAAGTRPVTPVGGGPPDGKRGESPPRIHKSTSLLLTNESILSKSDINTGSQTAMLSTFHNDGVETLTTIETLGFTSKDGDVKGSSDDTNTDSTIHRAADPVFLQSTTMEANNSASSREGDMA